MKVTPSLGRRPSDKLGARRSRSRNATVPVRAAGTANSNRPVRPAIAALRAGTSPLRCTSFSTERSQPLREVA